MSSQQWSLDKGKCSLDKEKCLSKHSYEVCTEDMKFGVDLVQTYKTDIDNNTPKSLLLSRFQCPHIACIFYAKMQEMSESDVDPTSEERRSVVWTFRKGASEEWGYYVAYKRLYDMPYSGF